MSTFKWRLSNLMAWLSFILAIAGIITTYSIAGFEFSINVIVAYIVLLLPSITLYFINYLICGSLRVLPWIKIDSN